MVTMITGSGAFSEVKKATRKEDGLTVAIKCIPRQKLSQHEVCANTRRARGGSSKLSVSCCAASPFPLLIYLYCSHECT